MTSFDTTYIDEPELKFKEGEHKDPRAGLMKYGPWTPGSSSHNEIKVGLLGTSVSNSAVRELLREMETVIPRESEEPRRHQPPFPSMGPDSPFKASFNLQARWERQLKSEDIALIRESRSPSDSVKYLLDTIDKQLKFLKRRTDPPPDVVVISLPSEVIEACTPGNVDKAKMKSGQTDFHDRIKTFGLKYDIPTQLIRPSTLQFNNQGQEKAEVAWNLSVGLLYKSREGKPWKVADLEETTCYAGISFYRERHGNRNRTHASMAQVFLSTGESFVIWGDPAMDSNSDKNNHLTSESAEELANKILSQYRQSRSHSPSRLVLHKTSRFTDGEREGFKRAAEGISTLDLVTIRDGDGIRLFPNTDYPPLRGTMMHPKGTNKYYLYTQGYVPTLETYPGPRVPTPIAVEPDPEVTTTAPRHLCKEVLSFTKLDWNTSDFCKKRPVTIRVARAVGAILAEAKERDIAVLPQYYYYM